MSAENISYELKRFAGIKRDYTPDEVERLRGSIKIEYSLCKQQSVKLWKLLNTENYISTLGSLSGNQAVQHAKAGLKSIYLSGWQVAADANSAGEMYPDQSLYPYDSAPKLVESMNNALLRADQIQHMELKDGDMKKEKRIDYMLPIIADGEAVAADANSAGEMYPDQSLYPYDSAPKLVESMNNALLRADQIQHMELKDLSLIHI